MTRSTRPARRPARRTAPLLVAALLAISPVLAGCSGDADDEVVGPRPSPLPSVPDEPLWNPCDGLDPARLDTLFDATFDVARGTPAAPTCTLTPQDEGDPVVDANYSLVDESLDEIIESFGVVRSADGEGPATVVNRPSIRGADDAATIVLLREDTLLVTGFVQNGGLVQAVNIVDPAPYDRAGLARATREVLAELAEHAGSIGAPTESPSPSGSPSPTPEPTGPLSPSGSPSSQIP